MGTGGIPGRAIMGWPAIMAPGWPIWGRGCCWPILGPPTLGPHGPPTHMPMPPIPMPGMPPGRGTACCCGHRGWARIWAGVKNRCGCGMVGMK